MIICNCFQAADRDLSVNKAAIFPLPFVPRACEIHGVLKLSAKVHELVYTQIKGDTSSLHTGK